MRTVEQRLAPVVLTVSDLLRERRPRLPQVQVQQALDLVFDAEPSYNWVTPEGRYDFTLLHPRAAWPTSEGMEHWHLEGAGQHPLLVWYAHTGCTGPQTIGRVPPQVAGPLCQAFVRMHLCDPELEQQLAIPCEVGVAGPAAFVLARGGRDFSDDDLELARRIQPLLYVLDRQVALTRRTDLGSDEAVAQCHLTGRELVVLRLLADGLTAVAIARRLGTSPRTVHKHLEHTYRKLRVRDRVSAVRVATRAGLLDDAPARAPRPR